MVLKDVTLPSYTSDIDVERFVLQHKYQELPSYSPEIDSEHVKHQDQPPCPPANMETDDTESQPTEEPTSRTPVEELVWLRNRLAEIERRESEVLVKEEQLRKRLADVASRDHRMWVKETAEPAYRLRNEYNEDSDIWFHVACWIEFVLFVWAMIWVIAVDPQSLVAWMVWLSIMNVLYWKGRRCTLYDGLALSKRYSWERKMQYCFLHMTIPGFTLSMAVVAWFLNAVLETRTVGDGAAVHLSGNSTGGPAAL